MLRNEEQAVVTVTAGIWAVLDSALFAAALGRLVWHVRLVQKRERGFFGREALLEIPGVLVGFIAGMAIAAYLGLDGRAAQGLVLIVSYLGPDGFQALFDKYLSGRRKGE
jgi:hypothetical protein